MKHAAMPANMIQHDRKDTTENTRGTRQVEAGPLYAGRDLNEENRCTNIYNIETTKSRSCSSSSKKNNTYN